MDEIVELGGTLDAPADSTTPEVDARDAIRVGASTNSDPWQAIKDIRAAIWQPDMAFVMVFVSPEFDHDALSGALGRAFGEVPVLGCTTAGEITPAGYAEGAITAASFSSRHFAASSCLLDRVSSRGIGEISQLARALAAQSRPPPGWQQLALLLADGISLREDAVVAALDSALAPVPLFGGSAGDGMCFRETFVIRDGVFHSDAALVTLLQTDFRFAEVTFDHFLPSGKQMVVTDARPSERVVCEINGEPAAEEYARIVGRAKEQLGPFLFASYPTLVRAGGRYHVRAIQSVTGDNCLKFLSAIDVGLVLTIGEAQDIHGEMEKAFQKLAAANGPPTLVLGFDCILRKIEIVTSGDKDRISRIFTDNNVIGFSTYGEQHNGMHVNQTFVGIAFFQPDDDPAC